MKSYNATELAYLTSPGFMFRTLVWITAKDRSTGAPVTFGFWNGDDNQNFTINAVSRLYYGAGNLANPSQPIQYQVGVKPTDYSLTLAPLSDEIVSLLRAYDARLAPIEIHRAMLDPLSNNVISEPLRVFKGQIDEAPLITPEVGGTASCTLRCLSSAINLTRTVVQTKSDTVQQLRSGDRFRRYIDISGVVQVSWGAE